MHLSVTECNLKFDCWKQLGILVVETLTPLSEVEYFVYPLYFPRPPPTRLFMNVPYGPVCGRGILPSIY